MLNITIACAIRGGVVSVGSFSIRRDSPYTGKYFRCIIDIGRRRSFDTTIMKKADMWLLITFL